MGIMVIKGIPHKWWEFWKFGKVGNYHGPKYVPRPRREEERHTMPEGMNWEDHRNYHRETSQDDEKHRTKRDPLRALRDNDYEGEMAADSNTYEATTGAVTAQEQTLLEMNAVVWNGFNALPQFGVASYHNDLVDMRQHIDAINNIILSRAAARANPGLITRNKFNASQH
jgi:hypothetical protein